MISFKHSGNVGDIIYSLPALRSVLQNKKEQKADYYLNVGVKTGYSGWHPLGNILLNKDFVNKLKPLLETQSYINKVKIYNNEKIDVDFDHFRKIPINPFTYCIPRWYFLFIVGANWDLSKPWLEVEPDYRFKDKVLVARNQRLQSQFINYKFINDYSSDVVFVGVEKEFEDFQKECPSCKEFFQADDFLQLAQVIKGSRFLVANQGLIYTLAESMKTPRILETNNKAANNIPTGPNGYEALFQKGFEYWFKVLIGDC